MDLAFGNSEFGRPFIAPPGVPEDVVEILRGAFEDTMNDPDFRADAEKRQLDLEITTGHEIQALVDHIYQTPPPVVQRVRKIVQASE
jgi:tripartite-type tricarboxylate transporter receptor subunit TctC